jgi:hypothetical protein
MERLSLVETHDTSAIEAIEAAQERRRSRAAEAANALTRRAGWMKSGFGLGAAAAGIGLGVFLACQGISLLLHRPTLEELSQALLDQAAAIERRTEVRVEAARREADERIAAAERARAEQEAAAREAQQRLAAAEKLAAEKSQAAEKATADAQAIAQKFQAGQSTTANGGKAGKTVVDFSVFRHREADPLIVTTGWKYGQLTDPAPTRQWCYVQNTAVANGLSLEIAVDGAPEPFNRERALRAGVTQDDVRKAIPLCDWFRGLNPNIREGRQPSP